MTKIINFFKKQKIIVLLLLLLLLLLLIRFFLSSSSEKKEAPLPSDFPRKEEETIPLQKETEASPLPKKEKSPAPEIKEKIPLALLSAYPKPGGNETLLGQYKIIFNFNQELNPESLSYSIKPKIEMETEIRRNEISFYPQKPFSYETEYLLKINRLKSRGGEKMEEEITYQFWLVFPEKIIFDEHH